MLGQCWSFQLLLGLSQLSKLHSRNFLWQIFPTRIMNIHSTHVPKRGEIKLKRFGLQSPHLSFHAKAETIMFLGSYWKEETFPSLLSDRVHVVHIHHCSGSLMLHIFFWSKLIIEFRLCSFISSPLNRIPSAEIFAACHSLCLQQGRASPQNHHLRQKHWTLK